MINTREDTVADRLYPVGILGSRWQFPSDHLPVGADINGVRMISWNVLNNAFIHWISEEDTQGLKGSMITVLNQPTVNQGITQRDEKVVSVIQSMLPSADLIALQECGQPFLNSLEKNLPHDWKLIKSFDSSKQDQIALVYRQSKLTYLPAQSETTLSAYPSAPNRPVQKATFTTPEGKTYHVINAHIPGKRDLPARKEFAVYVKKISQPQAVTVALGDSNFLRQDMVEAYRAAGFTQFKLHSPWNTIVADNKSSKCIDHIFVYNAPSRNLTSDEITPEGNLEQTVRLLNPRLQTS